MGGAPTRHDVLTSIALHLAVICGGPQCFCNVVLLRLLSHYSTTVECWWIQMIYNLFLLSVSQQ